MQENSDIFEKGFVHLFTNSNIRSGKSLEFLDSNGGLDGLAKTLNVNIENGLESSNIEDIQERKKLHGSNENVLQSHSFMHFFFHSFTDFCVQILLFALAVLSVSAFLEDDYRDRLMEIITLLFAIGLVVISGSCIELSSETQFNQLLKQMSKNKIRVIRDEGVSKKIKEEKLLVGDLILLDPETIVPCDCIIIEGSRITIEESDSEHTNNYESVIFITKTPYEYKQPCDPFLRSGSIIKEGNGVALVLVVGENTQLKINQKKIIANTESEVSMLTQNAYRILKFLFFSGVSLAILNFSYQFGHKISYAIENGYNINYLEHFGIEYLIQSLILIIIFIPDGLPILLILAPSFASGSLRRKEIAVRKLHAIGNAAGTNYICFDKTGTLTHGALQIANIYFSGRNIEGQELKSSLPYSITTKLSEYIFASLTEPEKSRVEECMMCYQKNLVSSPPIEITEKLHLSSLRRYSGSKYLDSEGEYYVAIKGEPSAIFDMSTKYWDEIDGETKMNAKTKKLYEDAAKHFIQQGFHVIGLAYKKTSKLRPLHKELATKEFNFAALLFLKDLTLPDSAPLLEKLKLSGIKPIIFTSESLSSNILFANELGISVTSQLNNLEIPPIIDIEDLISRVGIDEDNNPRNITTFERIMQHVEIISRASSEHKKFIIKGLKKCDQTVAMVGEGANDERAFKEADISITFNKASQSVKSIASIVIFNDQLSDVYQIFYYGRNAYEGVQRFFYFEYVFIALIVVLTLTGSFILNAPIFSSVQTIWLTLIDIFAAIILAYESPTENTMKNKPFKRKDSLSNKHFWILAMTQLIYQISIIFSILFLHLDTKSLEDCNESNHKNLEQISIYCTVLFHITACLQIFNLMNCRRIQSKELNIFEDIKSNPLFLITFLLLLITQMAIVNYGHAIFKTIPLKTEIHLLCGFVGFGSYIVFSMTKMILNNYDKPPQILRDRINDMNDTDEESNTLMSSVRE